MSSASRRPGLGQGSNSVQVRQFNERVILSALRRMGRASKADIARIAGLTNNAAGVIVRELEQAGLVRETGKKRDGGRGQPATLLTIVPEGAYGIGIRLDRSSFETVLVDFAGTLVDRLVHRRALPPPDEVVSLLTADVGQLVGRLPVAARSRLIGIGLTAPFGHSEGSATVDHSPDHFESWDHFDLTHALGQSIGLPVVSENDGAAAAVAELFYGHGRQIKDFIYLFIGPVIGGGVVLNGEYLRSSAGSVVGVASMPAHPSRLPSAIPAAGEVDQLVSRASANSLMRHLKHHGAEISAFHNLQATASDMPHITREWLEDCADSLVWPLLCSTAILHVHDVVIDGDLAPDVLDELVIGLRRRLEAGVTPSRPAPSVTRGSFAIDAGAIGAASLPMHRHFSPAAGILTGQQGFVPRGNLAN